MTLCNQVNSKYSVLLCPTLYLSKGKALHCPWTNTHCPLPIAYFLERTTSLASSLVNQSEAMTIDNGFEYLCGFEHRRVWEHCPRGLACSLLPYNSLRTGTQTAIIRITNCAANSQNCFQYPTNQSMPQRTWWPCLQLAGQYFQKIVVHTWPGWTWRHTCSADAKGQRENYCEWSCLHLQHMVCVK